MLGVVASRYDKNRKEEKYIYKAKLIKAEDRKEERYFEFALIQDDYTIETDFNNLSGQEGQMVVKTKSMLNFEIDDIVEWLGIGDKQRYTIIKVDGNRKESGELAQAIFKHNGNVPTYLILRKKG